MGFIAFFAGIAIGGLAALATVVACFVRTTRPVRVAIGLSWLGVALCVAVFIVDFALSNRWVMRGRFPSPDGRRVAEIETDHHGFISRYEVSFQLRVREVSSGRVLFEAFDSDAVIVDNLWDIPPVDFRWRPDSKGGIWIQGEIEVP